jgi:hypothetical protein
MVYDLRNYKESNFWGPYLDDGQATVDWEKMEAVMILLGWNLHMFRHHAQEEFVTHMQRPFRGTSPNSYVHQKLKGSPEAPIFEPDFHDPYGVSGTWLRVSQLYRDRELKGRNFLLTLVEGRLFSR